MPKGQRPRGKSRMCSREKEEAGNLPCIRPDRVVPREIDRVSHYVRAARERERRRRCTSWPRRRPSISAAPLFEHLHRLLASPASPQSAPAPARPHLQLLHIRTWSPISVDQPDLQLSPSNFWPASVAGPPGSLPASSLFQTLYSTLNIICTLLPCTLNIICVVLSPDLLPCSDILVCVRINYFFTIIP